MERRVIKISGESGAGLLSVGDIIAKSLKRLGYHLYADREYPSLIKGGHSTYQIDFSHESVSSQSTHADIMIGLDEAGIMSYLGTIKNNGILLHCHDRHMLMSEMAQIIKEKSLTSHFIPAHQITHSLGGKEVMANMVLIGALWRIFNFPLEPLEEEVKKRFADKPEVIKIDLECLKAGFEFSEIAESKIDPPKYNNQIPKKILINGNEAIALGAIQAGVRNYYAYPMSPSSSILSYLAKTYNHTNMLVKQAEDEITAAQMALGSMYAGSRALVATSGGGYDLMTETVSCAAITETPLVIVIAQRPGPATGLPTWTAQGDLNLAIHSGHGEYPKIVLSVSEPTSAYFQIQHALNFSEKFQIPVIVLTEKSTAEAQVTVDHFPENAVPIERGLITDGAALQKLTPSDRFRITENGLSLRWIPGSSEAVYHANGDEHWESGTLTEDAEQVQKMVEKRMKKNQLIIEALPEPEIFGSPKSADISFIGWGSSKNVMLDVIKAAKTLGININYLHYEYLWPLKTALLNQFTADNSNIHLIEGNYTGQLGQLIEDKNTTAFQGRLLKYNGRPFYFEEVLEYAKSKAASRQNRV